MKIPKIFIGGWLVVLAGCWNGSDGSAPAGDGQETTPTKYQFFPANYWTDYSASYTLSGIIKTYASDGTVMIGDSLSGTYSVRFGGMEIFNGSLSRVIIDQLIITNLTSGGSIETSYKEYYSTDDSSLMLIGSYSISDGFTATARLLDIIPLTAEVGDFGAYGIYDHSDGGQTFEEWALRKGDGDGNAKLSIGKAVRDALGVSTTFSYKWTVSPSGDRPALDITIQTRPGDLVVKTLSGSAD